MSTGKRWLAGLVLIGLLFALDNLRPPDRQVSTRLLLATIDLYQAIASPAISRAGVRCRFQPSCSRYAEAVIRRHGALPGLARSAWRLARCGPWTPSGTLDPPEPQSPQR